MIQDNNGLQQQNAPMTQGVNLQQNQEDEETININDFLFLCLARWKWFVFSVIFCLGLGCLYLLRTPSIYTRDASVMIKDEVGDNSQGVASALSNMGLFQSNTNVNNELLAFQSPAIIGDVIERLGLQTSYTYRKHLKNLPLYGDSMVINVDFLSFSPSMAGFLKVDLQGKGKVKIYDMRLGSEEFDGESLVATLGDTIMTPLGKLLITPGPNYSPDFDHTIKVTRFDLPAAIEIYQGKLSENLADDDASVIDFQMKDNCIQRADDFLNTLINIYNEKWVDEKEKMAVATSSFIQDRLNVIEQELGTVDSDIAEYKGDHLIPDVSAASTMYMEDANENTKRQLDVSTQIAITKYLEDYVQDPVNKGKLLPANSGIDNHGVETQIQEYNRLQLERDKLANSTGETNPIMLDYDHNLSSIRSALAASLKNQQVTLETQLKSLIRSDRATNAKIASSPSQAKYLLSVERQQKVKEALYLYLLQKREENELSLAFTPFNTRVITPPMGSNKPTSPKARNILVIAFVLGMLLPAAFIFLNENLNNRIRNRADLDGIKAPFVGEIPEASTNTRNKIKRVNRRWREILGKESRIESAPSLLVHKHGRSIINESFRMVRANFEFMTRGGRNRIIMVTSFNPGSGKSFISLNLAATLALKKADRKVLIIDLDLRRASVSRVVPNRARGIADYLSEVTDDLTPLIQTTPCEGLYILPVGTIPPNPSELLYSDRLKMAIDKLKDEYDYIFLDCPPAEVVADAAIITPLSDMTIFVVRAGLLDRRLVPELDRIYTSRRYNNFMVLLNGTISSSTPYRRYAYSNYYSRRKED